MRWGILLALSVFCVCFTACENDPSSVIESIINNSDTQIQKTSEEEDHKQYRELFSEFKQADTEYFKNAEAAITSLIGQKFAYGITAYRHSDELMDIAEMFFDDNSENTLNIYFALRGFEDKEYTEDGSTAEYSCKKKDDSYLYRVIYNEDASGFEIRLYQNGELKDFLICDLDGDQLSKICYRGTLNRTFISRVSEDGKAEVVWIDDKVESVDAIPDGEHGYVIYDGINLTGVIK